MAEDRSSWGPFIARVCEALGLEDSVVDVDGVLNMTREIAHAGARPMAPIGAYLLGVAVGRDPDASPDYLRRVVEDAISAAPLPAEQESGRAEE